MAQTFGIVKRIVASPNGVEVSFRQEDAWATSLFLPVVHQNFQAVSALLMHSFTQDANVEIHTAPLKDIASVAGETSSLAPETEVISYVIVIKE